MSLQHLQKSTARHWRGIWAVAFFGILSVSASADPQPCSLFGDHAVLQRGAPVPIWGRADPGEKVEVRYGKATATATADPKGKWTVSLPPLVLGEPAELVFQGKTKVVSQDVIVGDVWLCAGQSNMGFRVQKIAPEEQQDAAKDLPLLRHFAVEFKQAKTPQEPPIVAEDPGGKWVLCSPATVGSFSAISYFFGRELHQTLKTPVGLVLVGAPGAPVEAFVSPETLAKLPEQQKAIEALWQKRLGDYERQFAEYSQKQAEWEKGDKSVPAPQRPALPWPYRRPYIVYDSMIHPLIPLAMTGVAWYQGEDNSGQKQYGDLFPLFIRSIRELWQRPELPFVWMQLPNYSSYNHPDYYDFTIVREAQAKTLTLPHTGMAVAIDLGNPDDIHPIHKKEAGRRLALAALKTAYDRKVVSSGPIFKSARFEGGKAILDFDAAGSTLVMAAPKTKGMSFELAAEDKQFFPAEATLVGTTVTVQAKEVRNPVAVRYLWRNAPAAILYNVDGLPAGPFLAEKEQSQK